MTTKHTLKHVKSVDYLYFELYVMISQLSQRSINSNNQKGITI